MEAASQSVGLGGDGDEILAIRQVEDAFGVTLDDSRAHEWSTAGDVYAALLRALPAGEADRPDTWDRFATAVCRETGISPSSISPESGLLAGSGLCVHVVDGSAMFLTILAIAAVLEIGWSLM